MYDRFVAFAAALAMARSRLHNPTEMASFTGLHAVVAGGSNGPVQGTDGRHKPR